MKSHLTDTSARDKVFDAIRGSELKLHLTSNDRVVGIPSIGNSAYPYTLLSFAYKNLEPFYVSTFVRPDCEIILDSGAFTAWSAGKTVDIDEYIKWAKEFTSRNKNKLKRVRYINLDVIPGTRGVSATPEQLKKAAVDSMRNADYIRANGIDAIEVFHQDEPFELLKKIVDRANGRLIAISPRNDVSTQKREAWLKKVLSYCVKTFGKDNIPAAHGLAVTGESLCYAFPFYSVDSSSWTACIRFGNSKASGLPTLPKYKELDTRHSYIHALNQEILKYKKIAENATKLWEKRGIFWND